jgi:hypothetical protein
LFDALQVEQERQARQRLVHLQLGSQLHLALGAQALQVELKRRQAQHPAQQQVLEMQGVAQVLTQQQQQQVLVQRGLQHLLLVAHAVEGVVGGTELLPRTWFQERK